MDNKRLEEHMLKREEQMQKREEQHRIEMAEMKANIDENQSTTENLIQDLISSSSIVKEVKPISGKVSLDMLGSLLKAENRNK